MHAIVFNVCLAAGLVLTFAGTWVVFGAGPALLAAGVLTWFTTLYVAQLASRPRVPHS